MLWMGRRPLYIAAVFPSSDAWPFPPPHYKTLNEYTYDLPFLSRDPYWIPSLFIKILAALLVVRLGVGGDSLFPNRASSDGESKDYINVYIMTTGWVEAWMRRGL